jgi:tetratricopeptide (TPR) repeat protein
MLRHLREALELRDFRRMQSWSRTWIQNDPTCVDAFKWLARASLALKDFPRASYAYGRVLDLDSNNTEAQRYFQDYPSSAQNIPQRLQIQQKTSDVNDSELAVSPSQRERLARAEFQLGELYFEAKMIRRASEHFVESHNWHPTVQSALAAARALHQSHQSFEAIKLLREELKHEAGFSAGRVLLGRILFDGGAITEAQREWQKVMELDPQNKEALQLLRTLIFSKRV